MHSDPLSKVLRQRPPQPLQVRHPLPQPKISAVTNIQTEYVQTVLRPLPEPPMHGYGATPGVGAVCSYT